MRQRLCDQHTALHSARQLANLCIALDPKAQAAQHFANASFIRRTAEHSARIAHLADDRVENIEAEFLRDQAYALADLSPVPRHIMPEGLDRPPGWIDQPAHGADQRGLSCSIGAEQREDFTAPYLQVDPIKCSHAALVGLLQITDIENRIGKAHRRCRLASRKVFTS